MDFLRFLPYLFIMAGVTYLIRVIPFLLINKKIENKFINSFLYYSPDTVLASMTFPAILYATGNIISAAFGFLTSIFISFKGNGLLPVAIGACASVLISELIMTIF